MQNTHPIDAAIDTHRADLIGLSDRVWETPEILYQERQSCAEHTAMLRAKGFRVTETLAGIPTAVMGEAGQGGPVIAILGEYDALPGLSQVAGIAEPRPLVAGGHGHGCGHNLLGAAALLAACAVKDWLEATGTPGRVRYYGCPAEEGGAAKTFMVREGAFADVDAALCWHPDSITRVVDPWSLANTRMDFTFLGRASHAAMSPHLGRSALDAVELMNVGVNYLREHMVQDARIHYAYLDAGGTAPNVVQARAKVRYSIRAMKSSDMLALVERVKDVARGAALMTGTQVEMAVYSAVSSNLPNLTMDRLMDRVLNDLGPVPFDAEDRAYAARHAAVRLGGADAAGGRDHDRLDRCGRRDPGGADDAMPGGDGRHRHAGPQLADHRPGQGPGGAQGDGACGHGDGALRAGADRGCGAAGAGEGRTCRIAAGRALCLPDAARGEATGVRGEIRGEAPAGGRRSGASSPLAPPRVATRPRFKGGTPPLKIPVDF